jgi:hypothetical protein
MDRNEFRFTRLSLKVSFQDILGIHQWEITKSSFDFSAW